MSIIRAPRKTGNFYILDKAISEDQRLTWAARGLLIYLLGKPDHWRVSPAALRNETALTRKPTGRDGVYSLLDELIYAGYVTRTQERLSSGMLSETHYMVCETPQPPPNSPLPALPDTAAPDTARTTLARTDKKKGLKKGRKEGKPANFQAPEQQPEQQEGPNGLGGPPNSQQPPAPAPAPEPAAQVPSPPPPPSFDDEQPQQPPAPVAAQVPKAAPAPVAAQVPKAAPAPVAAQVPDLSPSVIDAINAQRLANGKSAWTPTDLAKLRTQAATAGITLDDAARWILERPTRNFFQASYYAAITPPAPAPAGPAAGPAGPRISPPAPLPAPTPEQVAEGMRIQKEMQQRMKEKRAAAVPVPPTEELSGPEWAINVVKGIRQGQLIGIRSIKLAAEVLGIDHIALQTEMLQLTKR